MKRFLCAGEGCALTVRKEKKLFNSLKTFLFNILIISSLGVQAKSFDHNYTKNNHLNLLDSLPTLNIGDSIPDVIWNLPLRVINHPSGNETITLGEYKEKGLIILDFWATYCKPCISSIKHYQQLLNDSAFDSAVLIPILVYDIPDSARLNAFFVRNEMNFMTVIDNERLNLEAFRNYLTGFGVVWIGTGRLVGVPIPSDQTKDNLLTAIKGEIPNIPFRKGYPLIEGKN